MKMSDHFLLLAKACLTFILLFPLSEIPHLPTPQAEATCNLLWPAWCAWLAGVKLPLLRLP